ncbi:MAG: dephospho-CoA kinase [Candidatus Thiodiazotropha lotti]|uniref:dephospho-CoA kinase n=1 Tax=Candidatus Thiodiazotropha endoloripes TaxID=1818881 RepID=UPI000B08FB59|nr:dephospho-CoA kinase [Candidatus Thiodiazotropha endoloripes]MCG7898929.1 dephospho-CoA kinase [Candidatus Thiodiazotropha weberae]MCG7992018.1 dephospho-CoA kinase [Candidatus Thiodiazotropha lotti]MCG7916039.1 dephospho-CoA kinase [Candidatus Thiodiazotropha weberae]MCG7998522.1 dephospho-CoA kinase [Candidatus Thiodiazotropha lotti]MCW4183676.1 dephospho-CoA kinase [Candidatus Thiodiazotropha weberae]
MLTVALTGGIGSGKSAVSNHFDSLGVPVIDADRLAHQMVQPGSPALTQIETAFGEHLIDQQGRLNRGALREIVFNDPTQRKRLESILHPPIRQAMEDWVEQQTAPYVILVIPLLFETGQQDIAQRILVVDCEESLQYQRVAQRDNLDESEIAQILASQVDRQTRLEGADDIIENNGDLAALTKATERMHQAYLVLSKS